MSRPGKPLCCRCRAWSKTSYLMTAYDAGRQGSGRIGQGVAIAQHYGEESPVDAVAANESAANTVSNSLV